MSVRNYPVPSRIANDLGPTRLSSRPSEVRALAAAADGNVRGYQLALLAAAGRPSIANWASWVSGSSEAKAAEARAAALTAAGYDPESNYYGILDPTADQDTIVCVVRSGPDHSDPHAWNGAEWREMDTSDFSGEEFVVLDADVLADILDDTVAPGPMVLRPSTPVAWLSEPSAPSMYPMLASGDEPPNYDTHARVAWMLPPDVASDLAVDGGQPADDLHCTLAYLGDTTEQFIDEEAVNRAVAKWARQYGPMSGEISGHGIFNTDEGNVQYASLDVPRLNEARASLVDALDAEGVPVDDGHGFTPHITLMRGDDDVDVDTRPVQLGTVSVVHGTNRNDYDLGQPVTAAAPAPDIMYAIVDEFDTSAVLDLVRIMPGPHAYRRTGSAWKLDDSIIFRLMGVDPPPVVEVSAADSESVIDQVDAYDKANPDKKDKPVTAAGVFDERKHQRATNGKFGSGSGVPSPAPGPDGGASTPSGGADAPEGAAAPPANPRDAEFDIQFAKQGLAELRRRNLFDRMIVGSRDRLLRSGIRSEAVDRVIAAKVADEAIDRRNYRNNRIDAAESERIRRMKYSQPITAAMPAKLQRYWLGPQGRAKIRWGTSGDFKRCERALGKYLNPAQLAGACANLHHLATGQWPGKGRHH